jgi:hypothetical protein
MHALAVEVRFDSAYLFLDLGLGRALEFPLDWFPLLQAAIGAGRPRSAISLDCDQVLRPELDDDMNVTALLASLPISCVSSRPSAFAVGRTAPHGREAACSPIRSMAFAMTMYSSPTGSGCGAALSCMSSLRPNARKKTSYRLLRHLG